MTEKNKEAAFIDFEIMIEKSWTWDRMTDTEHSRWYDVFCENKDLFKGSYKSRWRQMQMFYDAFLAGLDYTGPSWREDA